MLGVTSVLSSYGPCPVPVKPLCMRCSRQALVSALFPSSPCACAVPVKLLCVCCSRQALVHVLFPSSPCACAVSVKLLCMCCFCQALACVLIPSNLCAYAGTRVVQEPTYLKAVKDDTLSQYYCLNFWTVNICVYGNIKKLFIFI